MRNRQNFSTNIQLLLGEALTDDGFCARLRTDPGACARQLNLTEEETRLVVAAGNMTVWDLLPLAEETPLGVAARAAAVHKFATQLVTTSDVPLLGEAAAGD
jgi:hypothetical protein